MKSALQIKLIIIITIITLLALLPGPANPPMSQFGDNHPEHRSKHPTLGAWDLFQPLHNSTK